MQGIYIIFLPFFQGLSKNKNQRTNGPVTGQLISGLNFPSLDDDVPRRPSYGVYISQLIRFARASSHVTDFNNRNKFLTAKLLKQGYRYHKLRKAFSKFYRRHFELIEKYHASLKKNLCNKVFVIQNSMEIWYINFRKSLEIQISNFSNILSTVSREHGML